MAEKMGLSHRRLHTSEIYDRIELVVVPRLKTSNLSGDEWRTGVRIKFWFKGSVVREAGARDIQTAMLLLGAAYFEHSAPISDEQLHRERKSCDQPGCDKPFSVCYELKRLTAKDGSYLDESENAFRYYRKFCDDHKYRGDCDREDCDENYTLIPTPPELLR